MHLSQHASTLLLAAGFIPEFYEAEWKDIGGPESGPKLSGHPDMLVYTLPQAAKGADYEVVVVDGVMVSADYTPIGPEGWEDQF